MPSTGTEAGTTLGKIRKVADEHRSAVIGGVYVDEITAQTVVKVYDSLSAKKKEKFKRLSVRKMIVKALSTPEDG